MNNKKIVFMSLLATLISVGCQQNATAEKSIPTPTDKLSHTPQNSGTLSGALLETLNAGGYTYVKIDINKKIIWAAGPVTEVKNGDQISFNARMPMLNFHSKSLNRNFETIYFVDRFTINGKLAVTHSKASSSDPHSKEKQISRSPLKIFSKAENGQTIAEALSALTSQNVKIRGQVSKFTAGVMGKNWIHIRDSSTDKDITITTDATVALNDIVFIDGKLALNKDFGYGYVYDVIVEDAKVTSE